ncbi:PiggyBac transposable element-derived protein 4 [Dictyocoela muelleri]|nr:PiggyBac transposable element-derived protein 4 [Dictyocoela muelleri]
MGFICLKKRFYKYEKGCIHNSYVFYPKFSKVPVVSHYDYIETIIEYLIKKSGRGGNVEFSKPSNYEKLHLPIKLEKRSNCQYCYKIRKKRSTSSIMCEKCNIYLCITPCFYSHHAYYDDESSE